CLDCEEIHDAQVCPVCASETFSFLTRWVPAPEASTERARPPSTNADIYRRLIDAPGENPSRRGRRLTRGLIGLTAVGLVGWAWRTGRAGTTRKRGEPKKS